ncbi:MAG: Rpn family recombination-promoting nuclease/putative transposase [Clostridia bacterium]|nr:Rpn family recombination-promoting nuclease/putative transposase [Clostridia bacterium]
MANKTKTIMPQTNTPEKRRGKNLKDDKIFKAFFSRKGNEGYLIDFLKGLLKIDIEKIKIKEEVNLEQLKPEEKGGRLDLQATLNNGIIVNIELQMENEHNIEKRTAYYSSKVLARETKRGTDYKDIDQVIMINILNYELLGFDEYISKTAIVLDKHRDYEVMKNLQWYFIELQKFRKSHPDMNEKVNQWLALMDDNDREAIQMAEKKNPTIKKAREEITYLTGDAAVQRLQDLREKWEMDSISRLNYATEQGKKEGIKEGKKEGEKQKQKEIAKKMLDKGMEIENIIELTGLTKEEIDKL